MTRSGGQLVREIKALVGDGGDAGPPDGQLLARFADHRDESAFEVLVRRHGRLVLGVCRRVLADPHLAEDAFQATFLVLVHKAGSLDRGRPVADWLYTVAYRLALRARANAARRRAKEGDAARERPAAAEAVADDTLAILHEELSRVPERHRVPLVLSYLEGQNYEQVAKAIGCPVGSVGWRLTKAKEALHDRLTSRGVTVPAAGVAALVGATNAGAAVPAPLADATVRAALWFAGERVGTAAASAAAVQLARGTLGTMTTHKLALAAGVLLAVGLGSGTAWLAKSSAMPDSPKAAPAAPKAELPDGAVSRMGSAQFRHGEAVFFIAYTPDGKHVVTAGRDHAVKLWDRATGHEVRGFERAAPKKRDEPKAVMAGPGGRMMMTRGAGGEDFPVALSPDGKRLAGGRGEVVTVWDVATGKAVRELTAPASVFELVFTSDGQELVAVDSARTVTVWNEATGAVARTVKAKAVADGETRPSGWSVSPDGKHLVQQVFEPGTGNAAFEVVELATGRGKEIKLAVGGAQALAFSPDGKRLAWASFTDGVTVWDLATNEQVARFGRGEGHRRLFGNSLRFSPDGKTVAVTLENDAIELWDIAAGKLVRTIGGGEVQGGKRVAVRIVLGGATSLTKADLAFSPDGKTVAASLGNATVRQFDTGNGAEVAATSGHLSGVIAVGTDGRTATTVSKESVRVWDAATGRELRQWPLAAPAAAAAVSTDGRQVATAAGGAVWLWDAATGAKVRGLDTGRGDVAGLGFSPDGKLLATKVEANSAVNLWDTATGAHLRTVGQDGEPAFNGGVVRIEAGGLRTPAIVFSPDGRLVAAAGDRRQLCVWDSATGALVFEVTLPERSVAFAFTANAQVLAVLSGTTVTAYEVATGEKRYEVKATSAGPAPLQSVPVGGAMSINTLARGDAAAGGIGFTPDGRFVVAGSGGPVVRVWDALTGQEVTQFKGHQGSVSVLRTAADGRTVVSGSVDTTAVAWRLDHLPRVELTRDMPPADVEALWGELAKPDPAAAFAAGRKLLTDRTQAVALFKDRLRPVPAVEEARVAQLVANLGGTFDARRKATAELEKLGDLAVPQLKKAVAANPPLDLRQRVEKLLAKATVQKPQGDQLRELRAVEVLEWAATAEAKRVLEALAKGAAGARLTREAAAAVARMGDAK